MELDLSSEQQAKVDAILNETRDRIRALPGDNPAERRKQAERLRAESRSRIAEVLNPEQRARYEAMGTARRGGGTTSGQVWVLDAQGKPGAVSVRTGLTDGSFSELVAGDLPEGAQVIAGTIAPGAKGRSQATGGPRFGF
ncbi:MAG: hypothetical protein KIT18_08340 [Burkholderiales bacterium]|nr:hypothetical protein [Burkholderiales bacterium]